MIFLSIVITLVLDRVFTQLQTFRQFKWLQDYAAWMDDVLSISRLPAWVSLAVLLMPLLLVLSFVQGIFANGLFGLFALAFNVVVLFLCFGPMDVDQQVDDYLHSIDTGDEQERIKAASALRETSVDADISNQAGQVVNAILAASHRRIFACLFWFVLLGPLGAVFYRLVEQGFALSLKDSALSKLKEKFQDLLGYLEWVPARLTVAAFMLGGHFEGAFSGYRKAANDYVDIDEANQQILAASGRGAIQVSAVKSDSDASDQVKKARGLVLRSLVVWLLFSLLLAFV